MEGVHLPAYKIVSDEKILGLDTKNIDYFAIDNGTGQHTGFLLINHRKHHRKRSHIREDG